MHRAAELLLPLSGWFAADCRSSRPLAGAYVDEADFQAQQKHKSSPPPLVWTLTLGSQSGKQTFTGSGCSASLFPSHLPTHARQVRAAATCRWA